MDQKLAHTISFALHPILMPLYGVSLMLGTLNGIYAQPLIYNIIMVSIIVMFSIIVPAVGVVLLRKADIVTSYYIENRTERTYPLIVTVISIFVGFILLKYLRAPGIIANFMLGTAIAAAFATIITRWWKISIHLAAIGGLTAAIFMLAISFGLNFSVPVGLLTLMSGLVGWARIELKAHTLGQVGAGWSLGVLSVILAFVL